MYSNEPSTKENPYLHASSSAIFPILVRSENQLMGPNKLMNDYCLAPLGGELTGGGIRSLLDGYEVCFGRQKDCYYNQSRLESDYATLPAIKNVSINDIVSAWDEHGENNYSQNINFFLITLLRARVLGMDLNNQASLDKNNFTLTLQKNAKSYALAFILSYYFEPNKSEKIIEKHPGSWINNESVYGALDLKKISGVFDYLSLEKMILTMKTGDKEILRGINEKLNSCFGDELNLLKMKENFQAPVFMNEKVGSPYNYHFGEKDNKNSFLAKFWFNRGISSEEIEMIQKFSYFASIELFKKVEVIEKCFTSSFDKLSLLETSFLYEQFPVIFVLHKSEKIGEAIDLHPGYLSEFRVRESLKLGVDINFIATNSKENIKKIEAYLTESGIKNVKVCLFSEIGHKINNQDNLFFKYTNHASSGNQSDETEKPNINSNNSNKN